MKTPEDYMLPCLSKKLFGSECPGCGIQRSVVLVSKGEFKDAFYMYPAIYTLILLALVLLYNSFSKKKINSNFIFILALVNIIIILTNFFIKFKH